LSKYDPLDKAIITCLNRDARLSSARLARELGVSERTINNRIKRLISSKAIQPVAVVNPGVFGYSIAVNVFCESELGHQAQAIEAIRDMPEISYIAVSTGEHDIILQAFFKDSEAMHEFITNKLHQVPGIQRTHTQLIPHIVKDNYQWIPPGESFERPEGDQPA
jgi:Lrp/AsnC family transcriptional regulator for asnA, asnC and gidA